MEEHKASDLLEMGLMKKNPGINTEVVFLRNLPRRTKLYTDFIDATKDDSTMMGVQWGRENETTKEGSIKCNANVVLAIVGAKIPQTSADPEVLIAPKLYFPKQSF